MPSFGKKSQEQLKLLNHRMQHVLFMVISWLDFSVLESHRSEQAQNEAFDEGRSKIRWPDGKHNRLPSEAVDIAPYPMHKWPAPKGLTKEQWQEVKLLARFYFLAGAVMQAAHEAGVEMRFGGDWDSDADFTDQSFDDLVHFEIDKD